MQFHAYFDYGSPYAYLAWQRITHVHPDRYERAEVLWKPVSAGHIFHQDGSAPNVTMPNQRTYLMKDLERWAQAYSVPFSPPPFGSPGEMPARTIDAMRLHFAAEQEGPDMERAWMDAVFLGYFRDGRDITDRGVLQAMADEIRLGLDVEEAVGRESLKRLLIANTQEAYAAGAPGVPYFLLDDQAYWGNDRLPWVEHALGTLPEVPVSVTEAR